MKINGHLICSGVISEKNRFTLVRKKLINRWNENIAKVLSICFVSIWHKFEKSEIRRTNVRRFLPKGLEFLSRDSLVHVCIEFAHTVDNVLR